MFHVKHWKGDKDMAIDYNRQYVGARYVPQFFNNPNGSWDWAQGFQYEPLTMVKYGTNTYTSKQLVPATVGTPNANPEYWAQTGDYNGAIAQIQNEIQTIEDNMVKISQQTLKTLNIVIIGDSWTVGFTDSTGPGFVEYLTNMSIFKSVTKYAKGGCGYIKTVDGVNYSTLTDNVINDYTLKPESLGAVIYVGSINDSGIDTSSITTAAQACFAKIKTAFPNVPIYAVGTKSVGDAPTSSAGEVGLTAILNYGTPLKWPSSLLTGMEAYFTTDNAHLKSNVAAIFANNIVNNMLGAFIFNANITSKIRFDVYNPINWESGISYNEDYSCATFNNQYLTLQTANLSFVNSASLTNIGQIKSGYIKLASSYVSSYINSLTNGAYACITEVGNLKKILLAFQLNIANGKIFNYMAQSGFNETGYFGGFAFTYDRLINAWFPSFPVAS